VASVTRRTTLLIVGQESWPLRKDGSISRNLQKARRFQDDKSLAVISEAEFLGRLGLGSTSSGQQLSTAELSKILGVSGERIRNWVRRGLVKPEATVEGVHYFAFRQVSWAKTLCDFAQAGVPPARIRRSLEQLRHWLPDVEEPLAQLAVLERDGQLLIRSEEGQLCELTGQGVFDFADEPVASTIQATSGPSTAAHWFELGCEQEAAGRTQEAAHAYRQALVLGGADARTCFNLGNVVYALGRPDEAIERYRQALEIDRSHVAAWNNLGNALAERGDRGEAVACFQRVLELNPQCPDAHYNLADALEEMGRRKEALRHWQAYARHDPSSPWGRYARQRLEAAKA
jgi:tetratricopeptide (TPR) repeat protein